MHLHSKGCEYAIRALTVVSLEESERGFSVKLVCKKAGIPESFTRKIFQALVRSEILAARSGPGGGYRLRKDPRKTSLLDVICAVDGEDAFKKCIIKGYECDQRNYCSLHAMWTKTKARMMKDLDSSTIAELMNKKKERRR